MEIDQRIKDFYKNPQYQQYKNAGYKFEQIGYNKERIGLAAIPKSATTIVIPDFVTEIKTTRGMSIGCKNIHGKTVEIKSKGIFADSSVKRIKVISNAHIESLSSLFAYSDFEEIDLSEFNVTGIKYMECMFKGCKNLKVVKFGNMDTSNCTNMIELFYNCQSIKYLDLRRLNTGSVGVMNYMFAYCTNLKSIDLSNFDTHSAQAIDYLFYKCESLEKVDLSSFDTRRTMYFSSIFEGCKSLKSLDLTPFKYDRYKASFLMLDGCESLKILNMGSFPISDNTCECGTAGRSFLDAKSIEIAYLQHCKFIENNGETEYSFVKHLLRNRCIVVIRKEHMYVVDNLKPTKLVRINATEDTIEQSIENVQRKLKVLGVRQPVVIIVE